MSHDGREVANFILDFCESEHLEITNLSLQKIVYFCHVWSLVQLKRPLVRHQFEAWQFGPVLQYLYRDFKDFDRTEIKARSKKLNPVTGTSEVVDYSFDQETEQLLRNVISFYGRRKAGTLVELTHVEGGPWHEVWNYEGDIKPGMKIENASISDYYSKVRAPF